MFGGLNRMAESVISSIGASLNRNADSVWEMLSANPTNKMMVETMVRTMVRTMVISTETMVKTMVLKPS